MLLSTHLAAHDAFGEIAAGPCALLRPSKVDPRRGHPSRPRLLCSQALLELSEMGGEHSARALALACVREQRTQPGTELGFETRCCASLRSKQACARERERPCSGCLSFRVCRSSAETQRRKQRRDGAFAQRLAVADEAPRRTGEDARRGRCRLPRARARLVFRAA